MDVVLGCGVHECTLGGSCLLDWLSITSPGHFDALYSVDRHTVFARMVAPTIVSLPFSHWHNVSRSSITELRYETQTH